MQCDASVGGGGGGVDVFGKGSTFVDLDTQRSLRNGRICARKVVDELAEQDVYLDDK